MILKNKKIAVIGAGPVGLTMALLLQKYEVEVSVFERDLDENARIWGGTLDLHPESGQQAMRQAGALHEYFRRAIPMGRIISDPQGNVLFSKSATHTDLAGNPEINRNELRKLLVENLVDNTLVWNRKVANLESQDGRWVIDFENQPSAYADMVIVANGGMSRVRNYVTDQVTEETGSYIIQGEIAAPQKQCLEIFQRCNRHILMTASGGITFAANPDNNGALTYGVTFRIPHSWTQINLPDFRERGSVIKFLSEMFSGWHESYLHLFRATDTFVGLPSRLLPVDVPWKKDRALPITLIGDAAHIMPPFAGAGVNTGLMDAMILADNLVGGSFQTMDAAIADYEKRMFVYAKQAQLEAAKNEVAMHSVNFSFKSRFNS